MRPYLLFALLPLAACSAAHSDSAKPSGAGNNRSFAVADFSAVKATGPDDVDIRMGASFSVRAEGDPKALDQLEIVKVGDTLEVRRKNNIGWGNQGSAKIFITMPRITAAATVGPGDMAIDRVEGDGFKVSSTGPGDISIGSVKLAGAIAVSMTGPGTFTAAGSAKSGDLSVTGPGGIEAPKLSLSSASVSVMGPGGVEAAVAGPASVSVMGPGDVTLTGGAKCTTNKMGPGSVDCS